MLVQNETGGNLPRQLQQQQQRPSAIRDSPILARVERVLLRHETSLNRDGVNYQRAAYTQSLLSSNFGKESAPAIKRGLLWQQRDKLFSRWKERYFILTKDYLYCFRRASGNDRITEMGQFLFKIKLIDIERIEWENKKTYSTIGLIIGHDGKIYLRSTDGLEDWYELIEECMIASKERRRTLRHSHDGKANKDNNNGKEMLGDWLAAHHKLSMKQTPNSTVSTTRQECVKRREWTSREQDWVNPTLDNRLSRESFTTKTLKRWRHRPFSFKKKRILTDIDINTYDDSTLETQPSITSYRLNQDVLCIQPPSLRGSFRSTRDTSSPTRRLTTNTNTNTHDMQFIRFRERSYSDIQRDDRRPWRNNGVLLSLMNPRKFN